MKIQVSVVVPTYKRPQLLCKCLNALVHQNFPPERYEIIIVDDGDSEATHSLVEQMKTESAQRSGPGADSCPEIAYTAATQTQGPAAARNIGWRMARGEIIAFTDDDCLPEGDWLKEGIAAFTNDIAGLSGQVVVPLAGIPTDYEKNVARLEEGHFVTANCFYRRSVLEACGGFDERFTMAWREDADLQFQLLSLGHKLGYAPGARVIHPVRPAPWGISIKEQRKTMFDALLFHKHPPLYRKWIRPHPPLRYYGILFSTVGFLAGILMKNAALALLMAGLWAGLVLHFTFLRLQSTRHTFSHITEMLWTSMAIPYLSIFWRLYGAYYFRVPFF